MCDVLIFQREKLNATISEQIEQKANFQSTMLDDIETNTQTHKINSWSFRENTLNFLFLFDFL